MLYLILAIVSIIISTSISFKDPIFQVPIRILFSWTNFFTHTGHLSVGILISCPFFTRANVVRLLWEKPALTNPKARPKA